MNDREKVELLMHLQDRQFTTTVEEIELHDALTCIAILDQMAEESNEITIELFIKQVESSLTQQYTYPITLGIIQFTLFSDFLSRNGYRIS
ncbi:MAG: hypothetical protein ACRC0V_12205 [Fusobacteriaceae bacterium]